MYGFDLKALRDMRGTRLAGIGPNVFALGTVSMLTDISAEMITAVLPIYLVFHLSLTPVQVGVLEGLYQGSAAVFRIAGGAIADRFARDREVAAVGYGLSAVCKLGLLAVGNAWLAISAILMLDRLGKALRTAPRDALISMSAQPAHLGLAFGLHRAMDTFGALLGPLIAFAILMLAEDAYDVVFVSSFCIAIVGLAALLLFVRNARHALPRPSAAPQPAMRSLLRDRTFRRLLLAAGALGMVTISDTFIYLALQRALAFDLRYFPLLPVATALTFLLLAIPVGRIADRIGRGRMFLYGHALLALAYVALLVPEPGVASGIACLALLGAYYACTDGVLMAFAGGVLPVQHRTSGMALLGTAMGLARFAGALAFGLLWNSFGLGFAIMTFLSLLPMIAWWTRSTWLAHDTNPPLSPA